MKQQLQARLGELKAEHEKGMERLRDLQRQQVQMQDALMRIEGAMAVLQEVLQPVAIGDAARFLASDGAAPAAPPL